jgi:hypothetical protein
MRFTRVSVHSPVIILDSQIQNGFNMAQYESDVTKFIRDLLDKNPEMRVEQKENRATWWDKKLDLEQIKRNEQSEAPKQPYAYFPLPKV